MSINQSFTSSILAKVNNAISNTTATRKVGVLPANVLTVNVIYLHTKSKCTAFTVADVYKHVAKLMKDHFKRAKGNKVYSINPDTFTLCLRFRGRFLPNRNIGLVEYGIRSNDDIILTFQGLLSGGSKSAPTQFCRRLYSKFLSLEEFPGADSSMPHEHDESRKIVAQRLNKVYRTKIKAQRLKDAEDIWFSLRCSLQSGEHDDWSLTTTFLQSITGKIGNENVKLAEDCLLFIALLVRSRSKTDCVIAVTTFAKLRTAGPLIGSVVAQIQKFVLSEFWDKGLNCIHDGPQLQNAEAYLTNVREVFSRWDTCKNSIVGQKIRRVMLYMISFGIFQRLDITHNDLGFSKYEVTSTGCFATADFIYNTLDCLSLTMQRCLIFKRTGRWETLLHGEHSYTKWLEEYQRLKLQSSAFSNLGIYNTNSVKFLADLDSCISDGESIVKFTARDIGIDLKIARSQLNDLKLLKASLFTLKFAQESRPAPFAVLVEGGSSIAKSAFTTMLYQFYGKMFDLPTTSPFKYTRNTMEEYWSGFTTDKWCLVLDDIGFISPRLGQMDDSLKELISIVNNVPLVPPQAHLEDKGKTPVRAEFVIATTNSKDLNAHAYFSCPLAVQRRLPWVISLKIKPEYAQANSPTMVDPDKIPKLSGGFPNLWNITVEKVVSAGSSSGGAQMATHQVLHQFADTKCFLKWFASTANNFKKAQANALMADSDMQKIRICKSCYDTESDCVCANRDLSIQAGSDYTRMNTKDECVDLRMAEIWPSNCWDVVRHKYEKQYDDIPDRYKHGDTMNYTMFCIFCSHNTSLNEEQGRNLKQEDFGHSDPMERTNWYFQIIRTFGRTDYAQVVQESEDMNGTLNFVTGRFFQFFLWLLQKVFYGLAHRPLPTLFGIAFSTIYSFNVLIAWFVGRWDFFRNPFIVIIRILLSTCLSYKILYVVLINLLNIALSMPVLNVLARILIRYVLNCVPYDNRYIRFVGKLAQKTYANRYWISVISGISISLVLWSTYKKTNAIYTQGGQQSTEVEDDHFQKEERENVWKRNDYETTSFDIDPIQLNYHALNHEQIKQRINRNSIKFVATYTDFDGLTKSMDGNMFSVGGHLWVTNNHLLKTCGNLSIALYSEKPIQGINMNMIINLTQNQLLRMPERDLVFFQIYALDACPNLVSLIAKESFDGRVRAHYFGLSKEFLPKYHEVNAVFKNTRLIPALNGTFATWEGKVNNPTQAGDCGTALVSHTPCVTILGLHTLGGPDGTVVAVSLTQEVVAKALAHFGKPLVQAGVPKLSYKSTNRSVGELHHKSTFRWLTEGCAKVYGTYQGFRARPRSYVSTTYLGERIKQERNWEINEVKPDLKDWKPWNLAASDIVNQTHKVNEDVLSECVKSFSADIISGLSEKDMNNLKILTNHAAVNGIQGVRFLDKLNFNTSMGEPYNHSKKFHISPNPTDTLPDAKTFDNEVWDEFENMLNRYKQGIRACPVFAGSLKDEPRAWEKVVKGKIRVFCGAPVVWCLIVRKYLLTFVKVLQENQILFEAAPGCVAQSAEWEAFREHLVQHGSDQIVAGDYGKFDKKMGARLIIAAFDIIIEILKEANWTEEELIVIYGIAEDTAYSYCQFNGDLVMWMGSNPSGHPLTVIINSLVNSLYMRYCYYQLNPNRECRTFKKNVALLTYGDDNIMGVNKSTPWFNHTAIVKQLEIIGVEYTMADKTSESVPYISIDNVSFLKRSWRWDSDIEAYVCPLEEASIRKMLCICVKSRTISPQFQMVASMNSAVQEFFWYGKKRFESERSYLLGLIGEDLAAEYAMFPFPTWEELYDRYWKASAGVRLTRLGAGASPRA